MARSMPKAQKKMSEIPSAISSRLFVQKWVERMPASRMKSVTSFKTGTASGSQTIHDANPCWMTIRAQTAARTKPMVAWAIWLESQAYSAEYAVSMSDPKLLRKNVESVWRTVPGDFRGAGRSTDT